MESYCAGGSDYWVLTDKYNSSTLLQTPAVTEEKKWRLLENSNVKLSGTYVEVSRKAAAKNSTEQRPIMQMPSNPKEPSVKCTLFKVRKAKRYIDN